MVSTTGWAELMNGSMLDAVYTMYDTSFGSMGIVVVILFFVFQFMLYSKTRNPTLMFIIGLFFTSLYALSKFVQPFSLHIIFIVLVFELAGILYMSLFGGN